MKRTPSLIAVAVAVVGITSCGGSDAAGPPGGGGGGGGGACAFTFCATISNSFSPATATVTAGSTVTWDNPTSVDHNVNFLTPSAALPGDGTGNIPDFHNTSHSRKFNTPGTHSFNCNIHPGMTGTLTVQ
jgi:plastocyanin